MKDIADRVTGELPYDQSYIDWLTTMRKRVAEVKVPVYEVGFSGSLWDHYMAYLPADIRQQHNCFCCQSFFKNYAHLVYVEDGVQKSLFWNEEECNSDNKVAIAKLQQLVGRSRIKNRFWLQGGVAGDYVKGGFDHIAAILPESATVVSGKSAEQRIATNKEDLKNIRYAMSQLKPSVVKTAHQLLTTGKLVKSEVAIEQAAFLDSLYTLGHNEFIHAVSTAPAGFLHPRSSMISTLLEQIEKNWGTDAIAESWATKMDALAYQRPQAEPSEGAINRAEKLFAELDLAPSLERREAMPADLDRFALWLHRPKQEKQVEGVFGALRKGSEPGVMQSGAPVTITFSKFVKSVLPTAEAVQYMSGNLYVGTVAANPDAKPILQWDDGGENRKTYSWWTAINPSFVDSNFGIGKGEKLLGCVLGGWMNGLDSLSHHGQRAFWYGMAKKAVSSYTGLFPQYLRSELREVRAVIEAYNERNIDKPGNVATFSVNVIGSTVNVTVGNVQTLYCIDRWD